MNITPSSGSFAITAIMAVILLMTSMNSVLSELFKQTAIATVGQGNTTTTTTTKGPDNTTHRVSVGGGNITFSVNQFSPQITQIQPGQSVTFYAPNGSMEMHNVIFDLTNGSTISDLWLPFTLPSDILGGEVATDVAEELLLAPPYNLGEPMVKNVSTADGVQAIIALNKVAWQPAVVDQNDNVRYLEEQELNQQMRQVDAAFQGGGPQPSPLSTSYTMDGTEKIVSSGIILDVNGFAALEEIFPEQGQGEGAPQDGLAAEDNQQLETNSTTATPPVSPDQEAMGQQQGQVAEELPPSPFPLLGSFAVTFNEPGTYDYFCAFHPGMFGQIVVEGGG
jgi:plastocyanin